ncbi:CD209 antigen-like protein 2 [Argopecten irradians]|uniref:CD209 antigen-like protein 2 n=1 Tax=Argopecten irradians TaxID=31199 RepID=UPI003713F04B
MNILRPTFRMIYFVLVSYRKRMVKHILYKGTQMNRRSRYQWFLSTLVTIFCGANSKLWTRHIVNYPFEMTGETSKTRHVFSRVHCGLLCEAEQTCNMFEYVDDTGICNVFEGAQQQSGIDRFPNGPRIVFKTQNQTLQGTSDCKMAGYTFFEDGQLCYKTFNDQLTWYNAYDACRSIGARLIVLKHTQQVKHLLTPNPDELSQRFAWVGLTDEETEGKWMNIDGSPFNYSLWPSLQFNNKCSHYGPDPKEADCAHLNSNIQTLSDCHCNITKPYVCELLQ